MGDKSQILIPGEFTDPCSKEQYPQSKNELETNLLFIPILNQRVLKKSILFLTLILSEDEKRQITTENLELQLSSGL